jgi:hypothetical protein
MRHYRITHTASGNTFSGYRASSPWEALKELLVGESGIRESEINAAEWEVHLQDVPKGEHHEA